MSGRRTAPRRARSAVRRRTSGAGFGLTEAIVALAIVALGLAAFCQSATTSYRAAARLKVQSDALAFSRTLIDQFGQDGIVPEGVSSGQFMAGLPWRMTVSMLSPPKSPASAGPRGAPRAHWVVLETFDARGAVLVKLETAKLARETP